MTTATEKAFKECLDNILDLQNAEITFNTRRVRILLDIEKQNSILIEYIKGMAAMNYPGWVELAEMTHTGLLASIVDIAEAERDHTTIFMDFTAKHHAIILRMTNNDR